MSHINAIGASIHSRLDFNAGAFSSNVFAGIETKTESPAAFRAHFEAAYGNDDTITAAAANNAYTAGSLYSDNSINYIALVDGTFSSGFSAGDLATDDDFLALPTLAATYDADTDAPVEAANARNVGDVREFPSFGTPANIVNVPVYGQNTSSQIAGQSDAPEQTFTLNYVPEDHAVLENLRENDTLALFRIRLSNVDGVTGQGNQAYDDFYFYGKVASFEVTPSLTDSLQASVTLTIDGDFEGPYSQLDQATFGYDVPAVT